MKAPILLSLLLACAPLFAADKAAEKTPVDELLEVMRYEEMAVDAAMAIFEQGIGEAIKSGVPKEAIPEIRAEALKHFTRIQTDPELRRKIAALYRKHFTEAEIKEMAEFYRTPLGQKMLTAAPVVMNESARLGSEVAQSESPALMQKLANIVTKYKQPAAPDKDDAGDGEAKGAK